MAHLMKFLQVVQTCLIISNLLTVANPEEVRDPKLVAAEGYVKELLAN